MPWLMLLPYIVVVDGKPGRHMLSPVLHLDDRCYCQVADGMAIAGWVTGRCYYHWQMV